MFRAALEPSQPPVQSVLGFFLLVNQLAHDIDPSPPSSMEANNEWNFTSTPCCMPSWQVGTVYLFTFTANCLSDDGC